MQKQPSWFPQVLVKQDGVDIAGVVDMLPSEKMLDGGVGSGERWGGQGSLRGSPLQLRAKGYSHSRKCYRMCTEISHGWKLAVDGGRESLLRCCLLTTNGLS